MTLTTTCIGILFMICHAEIPDSPPINAYCEIAEPIYWSKNDTRKTKEQVDRENAKFKALCPDKMKQIQGK